MRRAGNQRRHKDIGQDGVAYVLALAIIFVMAILLVQALGNNPNPAFSAGG